MATTGDVERATMGYLSEFEHDVFVSYAHSDLLDDWSARLIKDLRTLVAGGLGLRGADEVGIWWDYHLRGNQPLTGQLREKVEGTGVLLVLMSEWYLKSAWCRDERDWFVQDVRRRGADRVFVVRACATDDRRWPAVFKDKRDHPLVGYNFVADADLTIPKGHPRPEERLRQQGILRCLAQARARHRKPTEGAQEGRDPGSC
jgi:TIR domain